MRMRASNPHRPRDGGSIDGSIASTEKTSSVDVYRAMRTLHIESTELRRSTRPID
jgi:hypothetical protein